MTRIALLLVVPLSLGAPSLSLAQPQDTTTLTLTLDRAMQDALEANPSVRAARAGVDESAAGIAAARSALFPRVTFSEGWQRGNQPIFVFSTLLASRRFAAANFAIEQLNRPDALGYFHATAGIEQLLFDGGARKAGLDAAHARTRIADSVVRETSHAIATGVVGVGLTLAALEGLALEGDTKVELICSG